MINIKGFKEIKDFGVKSPINYTTKCGSVVDVVSLPSRRKNITYNLKLDKDNYLSLSTGEIKQYEHAENKSDSVQSVYRTLKRLRRIINNNVDDIKKVRWVTLTYAENMTDTERLYQDFRKFHQRFQRYIKSKYGMEYEYISTCEPQGRGAWHMHIIFIFNGIAPYIPNNELAGIWSHGFVSVKALKDSVDNLGAYLTAYLSDMEIPEKDIDKYTGYDIKEIEENGVKKRFIKGARMVLYPSGFNLYRCSKGIKRPKTEILNNTQLKKIVGDGAPTYTKTYEFSLKDFTQKMKISQYNLKR